MKDEIKQMIDNLKFISEQESATIEINQNGCKVILDCITNLQEKVKLLTTGLEATDKAYKDYKTRNEKAIECIKHYAVENEDYSKIYNVEEKELLNILNGDDTSVRD